MIPPCKVEAEGQRDVTAEARLLEAGCKPRKAGGP